MPVIFMSRPFSMAAASTSTAPRGEALDRDVLVRPRKIPSLLVRGVPRPVGIVEVAAGEHAEVGAPRDQDTVHVVVGGDAPDGHRRNLGLAPDAVAERRLVEAAILRLLIGHG